MAGKSFRDTCGLCYGFCEHGEHDSVTIHVWERFRSEAYVPCNARVYVNNATGKYMRFEFEGKKYSIDVAKKAARTIFKGVGWRKFTAVNNLDNGCAVIFDLETRPRQAYRAAPDADPSALHPDNAGDENEDEGVSADLMKGVDLNGQEKAALNATLLEVKKKFDANPFVHRLTQSNIADGNMKLPPQGFYRSLLRKKGKFGIRLQNGKERAVVSYITSSDGRIILSKQDWSKFVAKASLKTGKHTMFYLEKSKRVQLTHTLVVSKI